MYNSGNSSKNVTGASIVDGTVEAADLATAVNSDIADGVAGKATADLALPKTGGTMTGNITLGTNTIDGLEINTTATSNLGLGTGAVDSITTGDNNTGVGDSALTSNTEGINNTAIGYRALYSNVIGTYNSATGGDALFYNTGSYNTASGYRSLFNNLTGISNTASGYRSLYLSTGDNNTALGSLAGDNITTGDSNIIIGSNVNAPSATANSQLNIGNWIKKESASNNINLIAGITFNGDTAAANALDDYEEGTWTPAFNQYSGSVPSFTGFSSSGKYTKVGNMVFLSGYITYTSFTGGAGFVRIDGLPYNYTGSSSLFTGSVDYDDGYQNSSIVNGTDLGEGLRIRRYTSGSTSSIKFGSVDNATTNVDDLTWSSVTSSGTPKMFFTLMYSV